MISPKQKKILAFPYSRYDALICDGAVRSVGSCPFDNTNCMCQFCTEPCNNGSNCWECKDKGERVHSVYLCTGFKGDLNRYLENWKAHKMDGDENDG